MRKYGFTGGTNGHGGRSKSVVSVGGASTIDRRRRRKRHKQKKMNAAQKAINVGAY
jgi:hypothetical protein